MSETIHIAAFYKFLPLPDYRELAAPMRARCLALALRGTILLAEEGINATVAGAPSAVRAFLQELGADARFANLDIRLTAHAAMPFGKMKVRLKREIVALKAPGVTPAEGGGSYVEPADWNRLITRADVTLIDARNAYEVALGSFPQALDPGTDAFHQLPQALRQRLDPEKHKKVAMFCTGGIRCEKAAAYLLGLGFEEVYQLRGGILHYLEQVEEKDSLWQGECFVFDERVSLNHRLRKGSFRICDDCKAQVKRPDATCPGCGSANLL